MFFLTKKMIMLNLRTLKIDISLFLNRVFSFKDN